MPEQITDTYTWEAVYNDGFSLWECNSKGDIQNKYSDIDREKVIEFRLYETTQYLFNNLITPDSDLRKVLKPDIKVECDAYLNMKPLKPAYSIEIKEGRRLIWRKRRHQRLVESTPFLTIYMIGWQETIDGQNVQSILYIYPDGTSELSERKTNGELDVVLFDFEG